MANGLSRILVVVEKHGATYMDASTTRRLDAACRVVLARRLADKYYDPGEPPTLEYVQQVYAFTGHPDNIAKDQQEKLDKLCKRYDSDKKFEDDVTLCLALPQKWKRDGKYEKRPWLIDSYSLLSSRSSSPYEEVQLESVVDPFAK